MAVSSSCSVRSVRKADSAWQIAVEARLVRARRGTARPRRAPAAGKGAQYAGQVLEGESGLAVGAGNAG